MDILYLSGGMDILEQSSISLLNISLFLLTTISSFKVLKPLKRLSSDPSILLANPVILKLVLIIVEIIYSSFHQISAIQSNILS